MEKRKNTQPAASATPVPAPEIAEQGGAQQNSDTALAPAPGQTQQAPAAPETPPAAPPKAKSKAPASIKLKAPYGFIDDDEKHRYWHPGQEVTDPDDIALLIERKAPIDGIEIADDSKPEE